MSFGLCTLIVFHYAEYYLGQKFCKFLVLFEHSYLEYVTMDSAR